MSSDPAIAAVELGPEHIGRQIRFFADGPVVGVVSKVDTEWSSRVLVELGDIDNLYNLRPAEPIHFL